MTTPTGPADAVARPSDLSVRAGGQGDAVAIRTLLDRAWGGPVIVSHGVTYDAGRLPSYLAFRGASLVGLLTYDESPAGLEVVTLNAMSRAGGVGTLLLEAAIAHARAAGLPRLWLITTNDNVDALRFYQRRGLRIVGVAPAAVDEARRTKASLGVAPIPEVGDYGIPLHDELTLELRLPRP